MAKIRDVNQRRSITTYGAIGTVFDGGPVSRDMLEAGKTQSGKIIYEIPLDEIKARPVNNYAITGIDELAESIRKTGLWQPIIVRNNNNSDEKEKYVIVAGERRYTATKRLRDTARESGDFANEKIYSSILAIILSDSDKDKEEDIYRDTNDYSRQITNFERIVRLDPDAIDMAKESWQKAYVEKCIGPDAVVEYDAGRIKVKGNLVEKCKYIVALLTEKEPDLDISDKTVRNYLALLDRCGETLRSAVLKGTITLSDARTSISWLSTEDQKKAVAAVGTSEYASWLEQGKTLGQPPVKEDRTNTKEPEGLIVAAKRISKQLYSTKATFYKIYESTTYRHDLDEKQKEYIATLRTAMQAIEKLEAAEDKLDGKKDK